MKIGLLLLLGVSASAALAVPAGRQSISCLEKKNRNQHTLEMQFDPSVSLAWSRRPHLTNARVTFTVPGRGEYSGAFSLDGFFAVNEPGRAGESRSYFFGGKPYRAFHGADHGGRYDTVIYLPADALGKSGGEFEALLTLQPDILDQGYYEIPVACSSRFRRANGSSF